MSEETLKNIETNYCERYGIVEVTRKGKLMTYYASYPTSRETYKIVVDLEKFKEIERKQLSRYYKKGELNMCL